MGRAPCCDKSKVKRGPWSSEEDTTLKNYVQKHGTAGSWIALPLKAGLKRCGKSCRLRWLNYLRPDIKHGGFNQQEDTIILSLYHNIGSRWSVIASQLHGRTDNDVKNYWNTKLKKKYLFTAAAGAPTITYNSASASASASRSSDGNSELDNMMMMPPYSPVDDVIVNMTTYQQSLGSQIPLFHRDLNLSSLLLPPTPSPPLNYRLYDDNAFPLDQFGRGLMMQPYGYDLHQKLIHHQLNFGYSPNNIYNGAEQEQQTIYQSFTY